MWKQIEIALAPRRRGCHLISVSASAPGRASTYVSLGTMGVPAKSSSRSPVIKTLFRIFHFLCVTL